MYILVHLQHWKHTINVIFSSFLSFENCVTSISPCRYMFCGHMTLNIPVPFHYGAVLEFHNQLVSKLLFKVQVIDSLITTFGFQEVWTLCCKLLGSALRWSEEQMLPRQRKNLSLQCLKNAGFGHELFVPSHEASS